MRVTDAMVWTATNALCRAGVRRTDVSLNHMRAALEATLADLPNLEDLEREVQRALFHGRQLQAMVDRLEPNEQIAALEAKLAKVREWRAKHFPIASSAADWEALDAILDEDAP